MAYLQIYKNNKPSQYNHTVLKGDELYSVNIVRGERLRWKYDGKIDKNYSINGTLIKTPPIRTIIILQNLLKPTKTNESLVAESLEEYLYN